MSSERISEPVGVQSRDVHEWRRSLRSPSPSGQRSGRSRTPSPSRRGQRSLRSRSPSPSHVTIIKHNKGAYRSESGRTSQKSTVANSLRKSTSNMADLSASLSKSGKGGTEGANIEAEYIRNLQQQVYYLELESNYLREQARKATETHPVMVKEADRMLSKLRLMQEEMDGLSLELNRRESSIGIITSEKERLQEQIRDLAEMRAKDKRMLMDEVITLKTEKDRMERELTRKDDQLLEAKASVDKGAVALTNAETRIATLKAQLEQRVEQHKLTQLALEEKRTELVSLETQLRSVEEKYYSSTVTINDKVTQDLRDEVCALRQKLKETEMSADKDRYLRDKINDDSSQLMRENAALTQRVLELEKQLDREKAVRESNDQRHATSISQMVGLKDKEGALRHELNQLSEQLRHEKERSKSYLEQLTNKETQANKLELRSNSAQSRISELESLNNASQGEITQLKRDKVLLVEHVADLQKKIEEKDRALLELRSDMGELEARLKQAQFQTSLELNAQSQKWEEFGRLADSMKSLSSTMAHHTHTASPRSKIPL